jgi:hypothetical protein
MNLRHENRNKSERFGERKKKVAINNDLRSDGLLPQLVKKELTTKVPGYLRQKFPYLSIPAPRRVGTIGQCPARIDR